MSAAIDGHRTRDIRHRFSEGTTMYTLEHVSKTYVQSQAHHHRAART